MLNGCPHCGQTAFPLWRKLLLGPAASAKCRHCGTRLGVHKRKAWAVMLPAILVIIGANWVPDTSIAVAILLLDVIVLFVVYAVRVPLETRGDSTQRDPTQGNP